MIKSVRRARGFTLLEMLIALALLTAITLGIASMVRPWLELRNKLETEVRLSVIGRALTSMYELAAFTMDTPPPGSPATDGWMAFGRQDGSITYGYAGDPSLAAFRFFAGGNLLGAMPPTCNADAAQAFWRAHSEALGMGVEKTGRDGHGATFCYIVGPERTVTKAGTTLPYRQLYVLSAGKNGQWEPGSMIDNDTGGLALSGDDVGIAVSGLPIQLSKFEVTRARLERAAGLYEKYFSMRYLSSNIRDVVKNYFTDPDGVVPAVSIDNALLTGNYEYLRAELTMQPLGVVGQDAVSAWEPYPAAIGAGRSNAIYMANEADGPGTPGASEVRTPNTGATPPYMAALFVFTPGFNPYGLHAYGRY